MATNKFTWTQRLREDLTTFLSAWEKLQGHGEPYRLLDMSTTLTQDDITPVENPFDNDGLIPDDFINAVTVLANLKTQMSVEGVGDTLYKLRK